MPDALVSCLMVTRNRARLARRSLACLAAQTWPALELVVVDDGDEDYGPLLEPLQARMPVRYLRLPHEPGRRLGALRNIALEHAQGQYCAQWDDDEWYHPERIEAQMRFLHTHRLAVVTLEQYLQHVDDGVYAARPFRAISPDGMPGTIVHERTGLRYDNLALSEDLHFHDALRRRVRAGCLGREASHLVMRCYHGANSWHRGHFERRLRRTWLYTAGYAWARWVRRDVLQHPAFRLDAREQSSVDAFFAQSRALGLLSGAA
jgi:glycosyltransferase involved in cell wall biosynthesis